MGIQEFSGGRALREQQDHALSIGGVHKHQVHLFLKQTMPAGKPFQQVFPQCKPCASNPHSFRFLPINSMAFGEWSMKSAQAAPRLRASIPRLPVPAKRSRTFSPGRSWPRRSKIASRTRSDVGRISSPLNDARRRPLNRPPVILIQNPSSLQTSDKCQSKSLMTHQEVGDEINGVSAGSGPSFSLRRFGSDAPEDSAAFLANGLLR